VLDAFPYPWTERWAQQLHTTLTQLFPTRQALAAVAGPAGFDLTTVYTEQAIAYAWWEVLDRAGRQGQTQALVSSARDLLPPGSPRRQFLDALLDGGPVRTDGEPRGAQGAPQFIHASDEVLEPEARLYHDDLTLQIGRVPALIVTLQRLLELAPAVCKLTVAIGTNLREGTAFRIGADLLLTNWHVVHRQSTGEPATAVTAEFGYEDDGRGGILSATAVRCDAGSIAGGRADDWAVIRAADPLDDRWPVIALSAAATPRVHSPAYIVQHPDGQRKRLGFVRNQVSYMDSRVVQYLTDTETGSSGSPVFDEEAALIAVHHAGGRPQEVLGRPPTKKNEGVRISQIRAGLAALGIETG
jgi:V8-like Glu-specific endopeptidase